MASSLLRIDRPAPCSTHDASLLLTNGLLLPPPPIEASKRFDAAADRDENGRKQSAKGFTIFTFTFFHQKRKRYDIIGNENDIGNAVISETKIYD